VRFNALTIQKLGEKRHDRAAFRVPKKGTVSASEFDPPPITFDCDWLKRTLALHIARIKMRITIARP
jgi:hypothetical protein